MPDQFAEQFRRYWVVVATVAVIASGFGATLYKVDSLQKTVDAFVGGGPRYSLQMHYDYASRQAELDARQNERLTVLEQSIGR